MTFFIPFFNVNDYVNTVLQSYSAYRLNFQSIQKLDFDIICHRIHPDEIIFLALSDDNDTPDQSQLFLSYFRIKQFIRLRSLTLIQPNINSLQIIFAYLHYLEGG
jgi:hypothetical protein